MRVNLGSCRDEQMSGLNSQLPPSARLIVGIIFFAGAVISTCTGKTRARIGRTIYRAEEPSGFWWVVAIYYLAALFFVGSYLYGGR